MSFPGGFGRFLFNLNGVSSTGIPEVGHWHQATPGMVLPRMRSMSENRAHSVAQAGVFQNGAVSDSLRQLYLDNARLWDCLCLMKTDTHIKCEAAIRIIFSLDDSQFLGNSQEDDSSGLGRYLLDNLTTSLRDPDCKEADKQRLTIENSRLHAILWVLRDNPSMHIDSTVAAIFRMDDARMQEKFGHGCSYSPGCLSLLMKMGGRWKPTSSGRRSPNSGLSDSQMNRSNRGHSVCSRDLRSQVKKLSGVKRLWSWKSRKVNSTANWTPTGGEYTDPSKKRGSYNTIWLMPNSWDQGIKPFNPKSSSDHRSSFHANNSINHDIGRPGHGLSNGQCFSNNAVTSQGKVDECQSKSTNEVKLNSLADTVGSHKGRRPTLFKAFGEDVPITMTTSASTVNAPDYMTDHELQPKSYKPTISLSATRNQVQRVEIPYQIPEHPMPRFYIDKHRHTKTDWDNPMKKDFSFCFSPGLRVPNVRTHGVIGPIDYRNEIIRLCPTQEEKRRKSQNATSNPPLW